MKFPQIGEILPNRYTVLAAYAVGEDRYVLAHQEGAPQPYVVWSVDQDGDTRNGFYFEKLVSAQKKFSKLTAVVEEEDCTEIRIILDPYGAELQHVYINSEEIKDLKTFSIEVGPRGSSTYKCERYIPVSEEYCIHFEKS